VLSFVGATGSTTISFILPGLFYWKAGILNYFPGAMADIVDQLTKDDPDKNKLLNLGALALACYGFLILVFWWVPNVFLRMPFFF
jgi:amino acid permease